MNKKKFKVGDLVTRPGYPNSKITRIDNHDDGWYLVFDNASEAMCDGHQDYWKLVKETPKSGIQPPVPTRDTLEKGIVHYCEDYGKDDYPQFKAGDTIYAFGSPWGAQIVLNAYDYNVVTTVDNFNVMSICAFVLKADEPIEVKAEDVLGIATIKDRRAELQKGNRLHADNWKAHQYPKFKKGDIVWTYSYPNFAEVLDA